MTVSVFRGPAVALFAGSTIVILTCCFVRFALPVVLRAARRPVQGLVLVVVAILLLPEWAYTRVVRGRGARPHRMAHEYGSIVARTACWTNDAVGAVVEGLARACTAVHPFFVGVVTVGVLIFASGS